jgi:hypothetical protein
MRILEDGGTVRILVDSEGVFGQANTFSITQR